MSTELLLIDLSSIAHSLFHQSANEPDPNWTANRTVARVHALNNGRTSGTAIALDTPPYFRRDIDPDYKANRAKEHNATVAHQIAVAVDALKADGFPVWGAQGYEADDIIATAASVGLGWTQTVWDGEPKKPVGIDNYSLVIASADKDMYQLISDRVTVQKLSDGSRWDAEMLKEKAGIVPNQVVDYLALVGDASDNIHGAKGIGAKTAAALLSECGNLDDLYHAIDGGLEAEGVLKPSVLKALVEFRPRLETVRDLIRLRTDAPIPFEEIFTERVPVQTKGFEDDQEGIMDTGAGHEDAGQSRSDAHQEADPPAEKAEAPKWGGSQMIDANVISNIGPDPIGKFVTVTPPKPKPDGPPESTALAPVEFERQLEPRDMRQAYWIAQQLHQSKLFAAYGTPAAVLSTILAGREMGFATMASLRAFHIIEGKPSMSAGAIHSLVLRSGKAKYFRCTERTATRATFETQRGDDPPFTMSYTIEEAQTAWTKDQKAWGNSGWGRNPADMLVARCTSKLARLVYPDVVMGLYAPEEM